LDTSVVAPVPAIFHKRRRRSGLPQRHRGTEVRRRRRKEEEAFEGDYWISGLHGLKSK
jgi:hypothetical protein